MSIATLAAAYAEVTQFPEAVATAQRGLDLARAQYNPMLVDALDRQIALYQAGTPFRDIVRTNKYIAPMGPCCR